MNKPYVVPLELYEDELNLTENSYVQGDLNVYPIEIMLSESGRPFAIPAYAVVSVNFQNENTGTVSRGFADIVDAENGEILYNLIGSEIAEDGEITASVTVQTGDQRLTWQKFRFTVVKSIDAANAAPPEPFLPWTGQVDVRLSEIRQDLDNLQLNGGSKGDPGEPGQTGAKGDPGEPGAPGTPLEIIVHDSQEEATASSIGDKNNLHGYPSSGTVGGANGWSPLFAIAIDGNRAVMQLIGYANGTGTAPTDYIGWYLGAMGYVENIADAVNIRGADGRGIGKIVVADRETAIAMSAGDPNNEYSWAVV